MNPVNPYPTRKIHPSAMRYTTRPTPTPTPSETLTNLLHLTRSKLSYLYASSDASSSSAGPESDQLRRSVLLSNAYDSGWKLRVETIEREREEREVRELKSVLGRPSASGQGKRRKERGWEGPVYEVGMDALFEDDEEDEGSEAQNTDMQVKVVDPSQYTGMGVGVEQAGEEAWFEQTWNELHGDDSAVGTVEVYPVEEDDSMYSLSSSGSTSPSSSRSTSPSSGDDRDHHLELDFHLLVAPPTPKLGPTKVDDKLEGPVEWGTMAAGLECGVQVEWIMERWEVLEDDDEGEEVVGYAAGADIVDGAYTAHTATEEEDDSSDSFSDSDMDVDMDVPDLVDSDVDEFDEQPHQRLTSSSSKSDHYDVASPSSSFDEPLLVTPTEDALDDFDQVDDESDGRDYDDDDERERKGGLVEVGFKGNKEGGGGGLFVAPRATSGGLIRVVR